MITGLYLLALAFTIGECEHVLEKKQDVTCQSPSPGLDCIGRLADGLYRDLCIPGSTHSVCRCRVEDFLERCTNDHPAALQYFTEQYDALYLQICGTASTPCSDGPDPDPCINRSPYLQGCIDRFMNNDGTICSSGCESDLEDHYESCSDDTALQNFRDAYNSLCNVPPPSPNIPPIAKYCLLLLSDECLNSLSDDDQAACTFSCRSTIEDFLSLCIFNNPLSAATFREAYIALCGE